jgi:hypothetical protein
MWWPLFVIFCCLEGGHMKAISFVTCALMMCLSTIAWSHGGPQKANGQKFAATQATLQQSSAELAFARLKTLAGNWKG